jgi:hypothetical protein
MILEFKFLNADFWVCDRFSFKGQRRQSSINQNLHIKNKKCERM